MKDILKELNDIFMNLSFFLKVRPRVKTTPRMQLASLSIKLEP